MFNLNTVKKIASFDSQSLSLTLKSEKSSDSSLFGLSYNSERWAMSEQIGQFEGEEHFFLQRFSAFH